MRSRFRVASRATGVRRQVWVHVYDDVEELKQHHMKDLGMPYRREDNIGGGVAITSGFRWPQPDPGPVVIMRLWTKQLTTNTVAHEAVHAATAFYFMDCVPGWDSRARTVLMGDHEPLAYLVGDITSEVISNLYRVGLLS